MNYHSEFDRLVVAASQDNWCWKIGCTTCGAMQFRNGLELIGRGELPEQIDGNEFIEMGLLFDERHIPVEHDLRLATHMIRADLIQLNNVCHRDWLGYLGMALWRLSDIRMPNPPDRCHEKTRKEVIRLVSMSWSEQLLRILGENPDPSLIQILDDCSSGKRTLRVADLTPINNALIHST